MKFHHEVTYPAAPDAVHAMLTDADFRARVCEFQQVLRHTIRVEESVAGLVVDVRQVQSTELAPAAARSLVGPEIEIEQRETWTSTGLATLLVTIPGKPGRMDGRISLLERGRDTVETVTGDIKVSVPLLGSKLEAMVGQLFTWALDARGRFAQTWLDGSGAP
ncbi:MAG: DUF2505 domain-containing protein [Nocardioides sp.]|uniref:DUF2505 domain-containing protein n=1 Tax=Nocardioides sp. TaxID=35761 RepID=UPI0039E54561